MIKKERLEQIITYIKEISPLNRYNVSDDLNLSIELLKKLYPELEILKFKSGDKVWDWEVQKKWTLKSAKLLCNGKVLFSHEDHPIRFWSGSWAVDKELSYNQLLKHLHIEDGIGDAIPWKYKYYWNDENFYGLSLSQKEFKSLDKNAAYHLKIDSHFEDGEMFSALITLPGKSEETIVISADVCHPGQVNDSLSGVLNSLLLYEKLKEQDNFYTYQFTFQAEMIGTMCLFMSGALNRDKIIYAIYAEMLGHDGAINIQKSLQGNTMLDALFIQAARESNDYIVVKNYLENCIVNDELIFNHLQIPAISLNRGFFEYYHTSYDIFENLKIDKVISVAEFMLKVLMKIEQIKYIPNVDEGVIKPIGPVNRFEHHQIESDPLVKSNILGPIFLSKYNLYVDWQEDPELNRALEKLMLVLNGKFRVSDIAQFANLDIEKTRNFIHKLVDNKLVTLLP